MDQNIMTDDKNQSQGPILAEGSVHRLPGRPPELSRKYGLWIINGSIRCASPAGGFADCPKRRFEFYSLSHLIEGEGRLWQANTGTEEPVRPGQMILIPPGWIHRYGGIDCAPYIEDAIRFCGPLADRLLQTGILTPGLLNAPAVRQLPPLIEQLQDPSDAAQIKTNLQLLQLLTELYFFNRKRHAGAGKMEDVIQHIKSHPEKWFQVRELAELAELTENRFRRQFHSHTGLNPKVYIEQFKLKQATVKLVSGREPIQNIAAALGYLDAFHFSRRFKLLTGMSPEFYRKNSLFSKR